MTPSNIAELIGPDLDCLVARADGMEGVFNSPLMSAAWDSEREEIYSPSTNWAQGGPIIERERILVMSYVNEGEYEWDATGNNPRLIAPARWFALMPRQDSYDGLDGWQEICPHDKWCGTGQTPLIAAMRAYVSSKQPTGEPP